MKTVSLAVCALLSVSAVKIKPDVFGPNGEDYANDSAAIELSTIKIDITNKIDKKEDTTG